MSSRHGRLVLSASSSSSPASESLLRICRPLADFLAPSLALATAHTQPPRWRRFHFRTGQSLRRYASSTPTTRDGADTAFESDKHADAATTAAAAAAAATADTPDAAQERPGSAKRRTPLSEKQQQFLDRALRVNHAGELAATLIYAAQTPVVTAAHPQLRGLMQRMYEQEAGHLRTFQHLLARHRVRPTALYPVWQVAATTLGWATAVMGREAAMACTEAVETEIGGHYNGQVRVLLEMIRELRAAGGDENVGDELPELLECVRRIRDEELEHLDHAVDNDAKRAEGHAILTGIVRGGCRAAIWVSERI